MRKRNNLDFSVMLVSFNKCSISALTANYLSVNRVNGIGENSNFSSQVWVELCVAHSIPRLSAVE